MELGKNLIQRVLLLVKRKLFINRFFTIIGPQTHQLEKPYRAYLVATGYSRPTGLKISLFHKDYQPAVETVKLIDGLEKEIEFEVGRVLDSCHKKID